MKHYVTLFFLVVFLLIDSPLAAKSFHHKIGTMVSEVPIRIIDGDTIVLRDGSVRIWGINTPERNQPFFFAAAAQLESLVYNTLLSCKIKDVDRYQRRVMQCWLPDGRDIAALMVASGLAKDMPRYSKGYYRRFQPVPVSMRK